ncbi:MAG: hypothetical protein KF886_21535 [Candidatus Hydrogenedentes bacterium]|nr:hypothetical protein [Candidatus Hydrogenedentota bacterium]
MSRSVYALCIRRVEFKLILVMLILLSHVSPASAEESVAPEMRPEDAWTFVLLPYAWLPTNDLTIGTASYLQSEFTSIEDALGQFDYGGLLFFEAHRKRFAFYADAMYVRLSNQSHSNGLAVHSDIRQAMIEAAGVRQFRGERHGLDLLAGFRYFHLNSDVEVQIAGRFRDTFHWVEPLVGVRHQMQLAKKWRYDWRLDFGGFGAGSRLTWQFATNLHYDLSNRYAINVGYRHVDIDYRDDSRRYDSTLSGPMLGVSFKF